MFICFDLIVNSCFVWRHIIKAQADINDKSYRPKKSKAFQYWLRITLLQNNQISVFMSYDDVSSRTIFIIEGNITFELENLKWYINLLMRPLWFYHKKVKVFWIEDIWINGKSIDRNMSMENWSHLRRVVRSSVSINLMIDLMDMRIYL